MLTRVRALFSSVDMVVLDLRTPGIVPYALSLHNFLSVYHSLLQIPSVYCLETSRWRGYARRILFWPVRTALPPTPDARPALVRGISFSDVSQRRQPMKASLRVTLALFALAMLIP